MSSWRLDRQPLPRQQRSPNQTHVITQRRRHNGTKVNLRPLQDAGLLRSQDVVWYALAFQDIFWYNLAKGTDCTYCYFGGNRAENYLFL